MNHEELKERVYGYLVKYKKEVLNIQEKGISAFGVAHDSLFPEPYSKAELPVMLYPGIKDTISEIQNDKFAYKPHIAACCHVASSQTACLNLFIPMLESEYADEILKVSGIAPEGFDHIERSQLRKGYCFEYWDSITEGKKGLLGDHSPRAGTDSDVAICYRDKDDNLCLWLIEHKLTEKEFTACGAYKSEKNPKELKAFCKSSTLDDLYSDHNRCHYHKNCGYLYWKIMDEPNAREFFSGKYHGKDCPFRGGMNQLWRNQMVALELERRSLYHNVFFSVVSHPENILLDTTIDKYRELTNHSSKFSDFKSDNLVNAAEQYLPEWASWYKQVYLGK